MWNRFWDGLKHSSAFCFRFDESGKCIQAEETDYILYEADFLPFIVLSDELWALNDYCYKIVASIESEMKRWDGRKRNIAADADYEWVMWMESEETKWQWLSDITASHLILLLYSYLEKTVKYLYKVFKEEQIITAGTSLKRPYLYSLLYCILGKTEEEFQREYSGIYELLEQCRKIRNNFAHDNLEGVERNSESDYIYESRKLSASFRLIDFISVITIILHEAEKIYGEQHP